MVDYNETEAKNKKNRSYRYEIKRTRSRHGHYTKYNICLSTMMVMCKKKHLSNIWSWTREKVKQRSGWVGKGVGYKKAYNTLFWLLYRGTHYQDSFSNKTCTFFKTSTPPLVIFLGKLKHSRIKCCSKRIL